MEKKNKLELKVSQIKRGTLAKTEYRRVVEDLDKTSRQKAYERFLTLYFKGSRRLYLEWGDIYLTREGVYDDSF